MFNHQNSIAPVNQFIQYIKQDAVYPQNANLLLVHPKYKMFYPYLFLLIQLTSFTRCASPPLNVTALIAQA